MDPSFVQSKIKTPYFVTIFNQLFIVPNAISPLVHYRVLVLINVFHSTLPSYQSILPYPYLKSINATVPVAAPSIISSVVSSLISSAVTITTRAVARAAARKQNHYFREIRFLIMDNIKGRINIDKIQSN